MLAAVWADVKPLARTAGGGTEPEVWWVMIDAVLVEVPKPGPPLWGEGRRGQLRAALAAIANAIDHAIGRRLTELPMLPPKIAAALAAGQADD